MVSFGSLNPGMEGREDTVNLSQTSGLFSPGLTWRFKGGHCEVEVWCEWAVDSMG